MECRNCSFQNTPGLALCVRCQSRLDLSGVDYLPPRARGSPAWRGLKWRVGTWAQRADEQIDRAAKRVHAAVHPDVEWGTLAWSVIPGLGHLRLGRRVTGWSFFVLWCLALLLALANAGTALGWLLVAVALGFHCTVVALLLARPLAEVSLIRRLQVGLLTYLVLVGCVYGPLLLAGRQIVRVVPMQGIRPNGLLANGDVIACTGNWTRPRAFELGDVVVYHVRGMNRGNVRVMEGLGVDRIVGLPGETISWDGNELHITGAQQQRRMPLGELSGVPAFDLTIGPHQFAIIPSVLQWYVHGNPVALGPMVAATACVEEEDIVGQALWRLRPWAGFGPLGDGAE